MLSATACQPLGLWAQDATAHARHPSLPCEPQAFDPDCLRGKPLTPHPLILRSQAGAAPPQQHLFATSRGCPSDCQAANPTPASANLLLFALVFDSASRLPEYLRRAHGPLACPWCSHHFSPEHSSLHPELFTGASPSPLPGGARPPPHVQAEASRCDGPTLSLPLLPACPASSQATAPGANSELCASGPPAPLSPGAVCWHLSGMRHLLLSASPHSILPVFAVPRHLPGHVPGRPLDCVTAHCTRLPRPCELAGLGGGPPKAVVYLLLTAPALPACTGASWRLAPVLVREQRRGCPPNCTPPHPASRFRTLDCALSSS